MIYLFTAAYRTPKILDDISQLRDYEGPIRQLTVTDLSHEALTLLVTNQLKSSPSKLIGRYAQRMIIENGIADGIDFFHMDALSSAVAMKTNCDRQLTLMASSLYRLLGACIGNGYEKAKSRHIFRDFVDANEQVTIDKKYLLYVELPRTKCSIIEIQPGGAATTYSQAGNELRYVPGAGIQSYDSAVRGDI